MKLKILMVVSILCIQNFLLAHNPWQSSLKLILFEESGILELNLAQYGVEQALIQKNTELDFKSIDPNDFKELLVDYLKENIKIDINGQQITIGKGAIKLGSHQTDLKFQINNIPQKPKDIEVNVHCFQENIDHQNFFTIVYNGLKNRIKLNKENNFRGTFIITESEILVDSKPVSSSSYAQYWGTAVFLVLLIGIFLWQKNKSVQKSL